MAKKPAKKAAKPAKKAAPAKKSAAPAKSAAAPSYAKGDKVTSASKPRNTSTGSYTLSEVVENIRGFCALQKRSDAKEISESIASFLKDALKKGYRIPFLGLGKLYVRQSKARQGRNPATGAVVNIPARKRVRFAVAKALKEAVLK
jgi:nucleoid DNA-binding protein